MILYITFLVITLTLVFLINGFFFDYQFWYSALLTISLFIIHFGLDAIIALIIHKMPCKYFQPTSKLYAVRKGEKRFFEKIGVKKWKDKIPEMGQLCNFKKDKIDNLSPEYIWKFLEETCYAEAIHIGMIIMSLVPLLLWPWISFWHFLVPTMLINLVLQIPPLITQRYNRPKLLTIYRFKTRKEIKKTN